MTLTRRRIPALLLALGTVLATANPVTSNPAAAQAPASQAPAPKEFRIGYQKIGLIVVARQQG